MLDLVVAELVEKSIGHDRLGIGQHLVDVISRDDHVLAVDTSQDNHLVVLVGNESGHDPAALGQHGVVFESLSDLGTGIDHVHQDAADVVSLETGQVGSDLAAFGEQRVTLATRLPIKPLSGIRISCTLGRHQHAVEFFDAFLHLLGGGTGDLSEVFSHQVGQ